jgi:hypothetical protein
MSILTVGSDNPNFSFVISKNPATIRESNTPFKRKVRKGTVYGWFLQNTDQIFRLWFKDHDTETSFASGRSEEFEYLDRSRYGSPYLPIAIITDCLASAAKDETQLDIPEMGFTAYVETVIRVSSPSFLNKMKVQYDAKGTHHLVLWNYLYGQDRYAKVKVFAPTVREVLNILQAICIMQVLNDTETYVPMNEAALLKFAKVFNRADSAYYPRYLFKMKAVNNRDTFDKVKEDLQGPGMEFVFGDTRQQRFDAIRAVLRENTAPELLDIGCGEMFFATRLAGMYDYTTAFDADEEITANNQGKIKGRGIENIDAFPATEVDMEWVDLNSGLFEGNDVLMTEVLEHIEKIPAYETLGAILKAEPNRVVVTVPNKSFNQFYGLGDDEMRTDV